MTDYVYPSAKIRSMEKQVLDATDIERMISAPDFESAFKVLNDTDYADNLLDLKPSDYRQALSKDYQQLYLLFNNIIADRNLFKLIFLERDLTNIKLLMKTKHYQVESDNFLKENCVFASKIMKEYIVGGSDKGIDSDVKAMINRVDKKINDKVSPAMMDTMLMQEYFVLLKELAQKIGSQFIVDLVKIQINNANLLTCLRAKKMNLNKDELVERLIAGGDFNFNKIAQAYAEEIKLLKPLIHAYYDVVVEEAFEVYTERDFLFELEKALDDYKTRYAQKAKRIASGPEVIMAYYLAKQNAVANIRIIMTGKFNKINSEEIKKTLRNAY